MSVRYCGDVEIRDLRLRTVRGRQFYCGRVLDPFLRFNGCVPARRRTDPRTSEAYDDAARRLLALAQRWARDRTRGPRRFEVEERNGRLIVRRVFQSPCPLE